MKKSYNPFKMWGSYVGALIGFFVGLRNGFDLGGMGNIGLSGLTINWFIVNVWTIFGFFIGYGIHSLIRRFRK